MDELQQAAWTQGCIQVYTGDGKGKTTAAFGLALRAAGAGLPVFIGQFMKGTPCSEQHALERFSDLIDVRQFGRAGFIRGRPTPDDIESARRGLEEARGVLASGSHRLVILDEANVAVHVGLFSVDVLVDLIEAKPAQVEVVITGRRAHPRVLARADLVTEMRALKHYYNAGVAARRGIEN